MDLNRTIKELLAERRRIDELIEHLERLQQQRAVQSTESRKRRGRKSMTEAERQEVSRRMRNYWEKRRAQQPPPESEPSQS
ncbi:MAG: hypothetical protein MUC42_10055 [Bryobacter sp.]|jgi:hypothetical protein|nr:hypothetical protein [Bryobacter sp.]